MLISIPTRDAQILLHGVCISAGPNISTIHVFHNIHVKPVHILHLTSLICGYHRRSELYQRIKLRSVLRDIEP